MTDHSLDPEDFESFRDDAHRLLDACLDHLSAARSRPWQPVDPAARAALAPDMPETGIGESQLAHELAERVLPFATGNTHPRFFGWVHGTGLAAGLLADMAASAMNSNCGQVSRSSASGEWVDTRVTIRPMKVGIVVSRIAVVPPTTNSATASQRT